MRLLHGPRAARRRRLGLSLLELMIGTSILVLLGYSLASSNATMRDMTFSSATGDQLQVQARRAMRRIADDLRRAATLSVVGPNGAVEYPVVFELDVPGEYDAEVHDYAAAPKSATADDTDFGVDRGILLLLPADDDGDRAPDFDLATGELVWDVDGRVSYARREGAGGEGLLVRTHDDGSTQVVARNVELVRFDLTSPATPEVPLDTVRVRLAFRATDGDGIEHRHATELLVRMRSHE